MDDRYSERIAIIEADLREMRGKLNFARDEILSGRPVDRAWVKRLETAIKFKSAEANALYRKRNEEKRLAATQRLILISQTPKRVNNVTEKEREIHRSTCEKLAKVRAAAKEKDLQLIAVRHFIKKSHPHIYDDIIDLLKSIQCSGEKA